MRFIGGTLIRLSKEAQLLALIFNDPLNRSDAIICLEGDGYFRLGEAHRLFKEKWAPLVVISGGLNCPQKGSYPARVLKDRLIKLGVPNNRIILEEKSQQTQEQAMEVMDLVKKRQWKRIILIASPFHQLRAFLTFLKAMQKNNLKIEIINAPAKDIPWFKKSPWGPTRFELFKDEFKKINEYTKKGHLATHEEAFRYYQHKEKNKSIKFEALPQTKSGF